jgi:ABC-type hemin transport system ATPase subunit
MNSALTDATKPTAALLDEIAAMLAVNENVKRKRRARFDIHRQSKVLALLRSNAAAAVASVNHYLGIIADYNSDRIPILGQRHCRIIGEHRNVLIVLVT